MTKRVRKIIVVLFWLVSFGLLIAFLFARPGASLASGPLADLYTTAFTLLGEPVSRIIFCIAWLILDVLLFWRVVLSRHPSRPSQWVDTDLGLAVLASHSFKSKRLRGLIQASRHREF